MWAVKGLSMEKWLCWASLGIAGFLLLLFLLDLVIGFPFSRVSVFADVVGIMACGIVGYLSWEALRELR
jgi:hypothetical protein